MTIASIAAMPDGSRSAVEDTEQPREVVEATLARVVGNSVEAAYPRWDLFDHRGRLLDDWAGYLVGHTDDSMRR